MYVLQKSQINAFHVAISHSTVASWSVWYMFTCSKLSSLNKPFVLRLLRGQSRTNCLNSLPLHICQHLEIRNRDTFLIAITPPPPLLPSNPAGSLDAVSLIDCVLHSTLKSTTQSYVRFRSIKYISSQFAEKRPGKILIYALKITLKTCIFTMGKFLLYIKT